jgi:hypothetical protein
MRRVTLAAGVAAAITLGLPVAALAGLTQIGLTSAENTAPSCPGTPCLAVSRTTGYQARVGSVVHPFTIPRNGTIVAWTITLGNPSATQITYFNQAEGGAAEAGLAILKPGPSLNYTLAGSTPLEALTPYFGQTAWFPLTTTIPVTKGEVIGLSVPTWAPALSLGFGNDTSWRASRARTGCSNTASQTTQTTVGGTIQYFCLYKTARLTYSATLISTP